MPKSLAAHAGAFLVLLLALQADARGLTPAEASAIQPTDQVVAMVQLGQQPSARAAVAEAEVPPAHESPQLLPKTERHASIDLHGVGDLGQDLGQWLPLFLGLLFGVIAFLVIDAVWGPVWEGKGEGETCMARAGARVAGNTRRAWHSLFADGGYAPAVGMRAIAMMWVVWFHSVSSSIHAELGSPVLMGNENATRTLTLGENMSETWFLHIFAMSGDIGVDLFFVLSGFLLGGMLNAEMKKSGGYINLFRFYVRRWFRIVPAYASAMAFSVLIVENDRQFCPNLWWSNLMFIWRPVDGYWDKNCMVHTWSIAVEFQMYLITPPLMFVAYHLAARSAGRLHPTFSYMLVLAIGWVVCVACRAAETDFSSGGSHAYLRIHARCAPYFCGLAAAIAVDQYKREPFIFLRAATLGGDVNELTLLRDWPLRQHGAQLRDCFASPRHRALMSFQDLYIGLPPDEAPAVFSLLQAIELSEADDDSEDSGVFYPLGGWGTIRDALLHACKSSGVNFSFKTKVSAIRVKNGVCTGVECQTTSADVTWGPNGEPPGAATAIARDRMFLIDADCVVCNADLTAAEALLPAGVRRSAYSERSEISSLSTQNRTDVNVDGRQWRFSSSTITFLFGLDIRYDELTHHNVFLGDDASWKGLFDAAAFESWGSR